MNKIKEQKKILEQRQKNNSLANSSSKRDRDEIDSRRKQLNVVREELMNKEKYSKAQIDRLTRQVGDLRQENLELRDEIAHYDQQLRDTREQQFVAAEKQSSQTGIGQGVSRLTDKRRDSSIPKAQNASNKQGGPIATQMQKQA